MGGGSQIEGYLLGGPHNKDDNGPYCGPFILRKNHIGLGSSCEKAHSTSIEEYTLNDTGNPYMGGCQNYGPFLGPYCNTTPNIWGTQKGTIILTTTHMINHPYDLRYYASWILRARNLPEPCQRAHIAIASNSLCKRSTNALNLKPHAHEMDPYISFWDVRVLGEWFRATGLGFVKT